MASGGLCRRQSAVHRHGADACSLGRWLHRNAAAGVWRNSRKLRFHNVLVGQSGGTSAARRHQTLWADRHKQFAPDVQSPRVATSCGRNLGAAFALRHPRSDSADGAALRISMTVSAAGVTEGVLLKVTSEPGGNPAAIAAALTDLAFPNRANSLRQPSSTLDITSQLRQERNVYSNNRNKDFQLRQERNVADVAPDGASEKMTSPAINIPPLAGLQFITQRGLIFADLTIGANVTAAQELRFTARRKTRREERCACPFFPSCLFVKRVFLLVWLIGARQHAALFLDNTDNFPTIHAWDIPAFQYWQVFAGLAIFVNGQH